MKLPRRFWFFGGLLLFSYFLSLSNGRAQEKITTIHLLEGLLHRPITPPEVLARRTLGELGQLIDQLSAELRQLR